jgi:hypothetical protein
MVSRSYQFQSAQRIYWGNLMFGISKNAVLLGLFCLGAQCAGAQALSESAVMTSQTAITAKTSKSAQVSSPEKQGASPHLLEQTGPPADQKNRQDFEANAGDKAGKLLLRSVPTGAEIFIDNLLVGRTPLLIVLAPGKYAIDMRGPRQESQHSTVGVLPKETQTIVIRLTQRYPATVAIR